MKKGFKWVKLIKVTLKANISREILIISELKKVIHQYGTFDNRIYLGSVSLNSNR